MKALFFFPQKDPNVVAQKVGCILDSCNKCVDNKLSLHLGKTECVLFGSKRKLKKSSNFSAQCASHSIPAQEAVKYLGIEIDHDVSGEKIAKCVLRKANARLKFLYRQGKYLNFNCRKLLCSALIQCLFDYASCSWFSGLNSNFKNKLQTTQNKIERFFFFSQIRVPGHMLVNMNAPKLGTRLLMMGSNFFAYAILTRYFTI